MEVHDGSARSGNLGLPPRPPPALELGRRQIVDGAVEPTLAPPVHPFGGGQLDLLEGPPGAAPADELGLVETHHRLGQGVVVAVAARADRTNGAGLGQTLGVADGQVLPKFKGPSQRWLVEPRVIVRVEPLPEFSNRASCEDDY